MATTRSTSLELARASGLALFAIGLSAAVPARAQDAGSLCPAGGFDICFPNVDAAAPSAACTPEGLDELDSEAAAAAELDASIASECLGSICSGEADEPQPGFFSHCCAVAGAERYDDFCVFVVQMACPAVGEQCAGRCPPLELLLGTVPLAPPTEACLEEYPSFIGEVCALDPFCCTTSWDVLCAESALQASDGS